VQSSTTNKGNDVKQNISGVLTAYLDTCKERQKWSQKLYQLRNPSIKVLKGRSEFKQNLTELFGPKEGLRAWAVFIRSIRKDTLRAKNEHAYYKAKASGLAKVLRYLRKSGYNK
jgi:hypothetical protein